MWMFLLGLVGTAAAGGGGGGGGSASTPSRDTVTVPPIVDAEETPGDDHMGDDTVAGDDSMDHGDDHMGDDTMAGDDSMDHGDDHMGDDTMAGDDSMDHGDDHMGHDTMAGDDGMDHGHDHMGDDAVVLPTTSAEILAFVAAVRAAPETHTHDHSSAKAGEHMAALDLVPRDEATHIAIANGAWDDPANWHNGEVPGDDAKVLIPDGVHMVYEHVSEAELFTVRVDGNLEFATDVDSKLALDTLVISPSGKLTIGTEAEPVSADVDVDIVFLNNGPIDVDWDPMLLSRGMISHGETSIHGAAKDSHEKVIDDPMAGDTWVDFGSDAPEGWVIGDTIVIAGSRYDNSYHVGSGHTGIIESQDEVRVITQIEDGMVFFDDPLVFDHDAPREDLKISVANYTRNVSFETEDAATAEIHERGHVMFMHNDDVDVRYAEFHELGRTDKFEDARNPDEFDDIASDSNVKGRYSFHFHRSGVEDMENPAIAEGNAVFGSPGWGFVHHDSNAVLQNNATFNTFGAGYVAESGNETGSWHDNIAIYAKGIAWVHAKQGNPPADFDLGKTGDGFWFQGRMVAATDNVAASVNHGYVYFHRGPVGEDGMIRHDSDVSEIATVLNYSHNLTPDSHPILEFAGNEAFAANRGLEVVKAHPNQNHDVHSVLEDFTAWNVEEGAFFEYTSHYTLKNFDIIGKEGDGAQVPDATMGIYFGSRTFDMSIVDSTIDNVVNGISLYKGTPDGIDPEAHQYKVVNAEFGDQVTNDYLNYDPALDEIYTTETLPNLTPDIQLDAPLTFKEGNVYEDPERGVLTISGTKTDSLGETGLPAGIDSYAIYQPQVVRLLEENGYYTTSDGQNYFMLDLHFSDRLTGDIYYESHPVMLDENVPLGSWIFSGAQSNGILDLGGEEDPTVEAAQLWATLTEGQLVHSDYALEQEKLDPDFDVDTI